MRKTQFNIRLESAVIDDLDAWVADLNETRTLPVDRSKLIRAVLRWAASARPDFDRVAKAPEPARRVEHDEGAAPSKKPRK